MRIPEGSSTRRVLALMGSAIAGLRLVVDVKATRTPLRSGESGAARWSGAAPRRRRPVGGVSRPCRSGWDGSRGCMPADRSQGRRRPPRGPPPGGRRRPGPTRPPTTVDDGGQLGPELLRPSAGSLGADGGSVLGWVPDGRPGGGVSVTYPQRRRPPRRSWSVRARARRSATVTPSPSTYCSTLAHSAKDTSHGAPRGAS